MAHPSDGIYKRDGQGYIAVSDVLGRTLPLFNPSKASSLEWWQNNEPDAAEILEHGQQRGTFIHAEVELALTGSNEIHAADRPSYEQMIAYNIHGYMTYLQPLLEEMKKQNPCSSLCSNGEIEHGGNCMVDGSPACNNLQASLLIEKPIFSPYGWAGTPDVRLWWEQQYTIWDWKSVRSHREEGVQKKPRSMSYYTEAYVQIGAYALAHNILTKRHEWMTPITQGVICICYDWREPHVHILDKAKLKKAACVFIERYKVYQDLVNLKFPIKL